MRLEQVTLVQLSFPIVGGRTVEQETSRLICWAEKKSVKRAEFYGSMAAGTRVDAIFELSPVDYGSQQRLEHGSDRYDVVRAYEATPHSVELTCQRRDAR